MPELPEVETVVRELRPLLVGRRLASVQRDRKALRRPWRTAWQSRLRGCLVESIRRRGKWILIDLDSGSRLVVHLGMTGQLTVEEATIPLRHHTHLVFPLSSEGRNGGQQLRFRDVRRFGSATLFENEAEVERFFEEAGLGPEPFDLEPDAWRLSLRSTQRCLKAVLLDQRVVAGVGNIYADESLFASRLHPAREAGTLSAAKAESLRRSIVEVLERAIANRGSTIRDYVGGSGLQGGHQDEFRVYGRTGEPCLACGAVIVCERLAGRSSHYCPRCQPFRRSGSPA